MKPFTTHFTCNKQKQSIIQLIHVIDKIYLSEYFTLIFVYARVVLNPYCKLLNLSDLILCWCGFNQIRSAIDFDSVFLPLAIWLIILLGQCR